MLGDRPTLEVMTLASVDPLWLDRSLSVDGYRLDEMHRHLRNSDKLCSNRAPPPNPRNRLSSSKCSTSHRPVAGTTFKMTMLVNYVDASAHAQEIVIFMFKAEIAQWKVPLNLIYLMEPSIIYSIEPSSAYYFI